MPQATDDAVLVRDLHDAAVAASRRHVDPGMLRRALEQPDAASHPLVALVHAILARGRRRGAHATRFELTAARTGAHDAVGASWHGEPLDPALRDGLAVALDVVLGLPEGAPELDARSERELAAGGEQLALAAARLAVPGGAAVLVSHAGVAGSTLDDIDRALAAGRDALERDDLAAAVTQLRDARRIARDLTGAVSWREIAARLALAQTAQQLDRDAEATQLLAATARELATFTAPLWLRREVASQRGRTALDLGDIATAATELERAVAFHGQDADADPALLPWLRSWRLIARAIGGNAEARAALPRTLPAIEAQPTERERGRAAILRARASIVLNRPDDAATAYATAFASIGGERPRELDRYAQVLDQLGRSAAGKLRARASARRAVLSRIPWQAD